MSTVLRAGPSVRPDDKTWTWDSMTGVSHAALKPPYCDTCQAV